MADQKKILAKPLIVADVVDCNGNCYPRETLEKMVEEYNKLPRDRQVWATRDFGQQTVDIQGYVSAHQRPHGLEIFVIYQNPSDHPGMFVTRRWIVGDTMNAESKPMAVVETLDDARLVLPSGLIRLGRAPADDPVIVETWI
ncbi:MAG: hypothetical protein ACYTEX_11125 [Planctomycetota bacterium]